LKYILSELAVGTVQGAVATWRPRMTYFGRRQVATAPCTVPTDREKLARQR